MSALEDALRLAAEKGMTHLTLYPVESHDKKLMYWHAKATPSTGHSYVQITTTDPVDAVVKVLEALPKAPKRAAPTKRFDEVNPPISEMPQRAVTAAVTDDQPQTEEIDKWLPQA